MMKTISVILIVLMMALVLPGVSAELTPVSITEQIIVDVNATEQIPSVNKSIAEVNKTPVIVTPTPVPTLQSMAYAYELANGNTYPNYKVALVPVYKGDGKGALYIQDMCFHSLISKQVVMQKVTNPTNIPFTSGTLVSKEFIELFEVSGFQDQLSLDHTGGWNNRVLPGIYTVTLLDGNGGQPEYAVVQVFESYRSNVYFIGHGVTFQSADDVCSPIYTITEATYGINTQCSQVIDVAAHMEYRHKVGSWWNWHWTTWSVNSVGGCNEQTRYVAATYKTVCIGENIDVTGNVQSVVNGGATTFLFNNARSPGGIFDGTTTNLLSQIEDPAVGIVKDVVISYTNGCGVTNTIQTKEYCTINLVSGSATCQGGEPN